MCKIPYVIDNYSKLVTYICQALRELPESIYILSKKTICYQKMQIIRGVIPKTDILGISLIIP